jgi:hypothetical protein
MKKITLQQACTILEKASAIIVDYTVTYPQLSELVGETANQFLYVSWEDGDHREFSVVFEEGDNLFVEVEGSSLYLIDNEGDRTPITILVPVADATLLL